MSAEDRLEQLRERYESGDADSLLEAISICLSKPIAAPKWVQSAYGRGYVLYTGYYERELGKAFGIFRPKGFNLNAAHRRYLNKGNVYLRVYDLHAHNGHPINRELFEKVAKEFGLNGTLVEELYYEYARQIKR